MFAHKSYLVRVGQNANKRHRHEMLSKWSRSVNDKKKNFLNILIRH